MPMVIRAHGGVSIEMAHPKLKTKKPRYRELQTVSAGRSRRRLITLSRHGVGRRAVHEVTEIDHRTLARIKNGKTKYVRRETQELIFSVSLNAHCDHALVRASETRRMIRTLTKRHDMGFTQSEIAKRIGNKPRTNGYATLHIGRKANVLARSQMRIEKLYRDAVGAA
jgi:hypothetical protein